MSETPTVAAFTCTEAGCQIALGETCLEGFPDPNGCPHASLTSAGHPDPDSGEAAAEHTGDEVEQTASEDVVDPDNRNEIQEPELVAVPGDEALSIAEAGAMMARHPVTVVLVAGEAAAGKTTLVAEVFARFLHGRFGEWAFGGSDTLRAFHIRLHPSFAESGAGTGTTERTADEDLRFLHLDLERDGQRIHILASDGKGEYFENLIDGSPVGQEVRIAGRVDRCVIAVDGTRLNNPTLRDSTLRRARLLLRALRGPEGITESCPVALVCTKWDTVEEANRALVLERLNALAATQDGNVIVLTASVRPGPPLEEVLGLEELLDFIGQPPPAATSTRPRAGGVDADVTDRYFWRSRRANAEDSDE